MAHQNHACKHFFLHGGLVWLPTPRRIPSGPTAPGLLGPPSSTSKQAQGLCRPERSQRRRMDGTGQPQLEDDVQLRHVLRSKGLVQVTVGDLVCFRSRVHGVVSQAARGGCFTGVLLLKDLCSMAWTTSSPRWVRTTMVSLPGRRPRNALLSGTLPYSATKSAT